VQRPSGGTQGDALAQPLCSLFVSALSKGKSKAIRPKFSLLPLHGKRRDGDLCTRPQLCRPMTTIVVLAFGLCMIKDNHSIGIRNIIYLKTSTFTIHSSSNDSVKAATSALRPLLLARTEFQTLPILQTRSEPSTESPSLTESSVTLPA